MNFPLHEPLDDLVTDDLFRNIRVLIYGIDTPHRAGA
jgi:hypothetical protein